MRMEVPGQRRDLERRRSAIEAPQRRGEDVGQPGGTLVLGAGRGGHGEPPRHLDADRTQLRQAAELRPHARRRVVRLEVVQPEHPAHQDAFAVRASRRTVPRSPSTSTRSPSLSTVVAMAQAVTVGTPYSRPTMAAWDKVPPPSQTHAAIVAKAGVQFGEVDSQTRTSPG